MTNIPPHSYPSKWSRIFLLSIEEIVGKESLSGVLSRANLEHLSNHNPHENQLEPLSFSEITSIQVSLEQIYGKKGGGGLALRAGRVFFKNGLKEFGEEMGLTGPEFRLLPMDKKIIAGLEALAGLFNQHTDQKVRVEELSKATLWIIDPCPFCWNRSADEHVCYMEVGMIQEALSWISGGKFFHVEEIECLALGGSTCTIAIAKSSLD